MKITKSIDFNRLLILSNYGILLINTIFYFKFGGNRYVNLVSIGICFLLFFEVNIILNYEKKKRNPFIIITVFIVVFFYLTRIATLLWEPYSQAMVRYNVDVSSVNTLLLCLFLSIGAIFFGSYLGYYTKRKSFKKITDYKNERHINKRKDIRPPISSAVILFLFVAANIKFFLTNIFFHFNNNIKGELSFIINNIDSIFSFWPILIFVFIYLILYKKFLPKRVLFNFVFFILSFIFLKFIFGSRSSGYTIIILYIICSLAIYNRILLDWKLIVLSVLLIIFTSITFNYVSFLRRQKHEYDHNFSSLSYIINYATDTDLIFDNYWKHNAIKLFDRVGFIDKPASFIGRSEDCRKIVNFKYYLKSLADKLSPGIDFFDTRFACVAIRTVYLEIPVSSIKTYTSDQFSIFAEYYLLFGKYLAIIFIFAGAFIFGWLYKFIDYGHPYFSNVKKAFVLFIFYQFWLNSFGTDYAVQQIIMLIISYFATVTVISIFKMFSLASNPHIFIDNVFSGESYSHRNAS